MQKLPAIEDDQCHCAETECAEADFIASDASCLQSVYCKTAEECIDHCFEDGKYRFVDAEGNPMAVELPCDVYDDAKDAMRNRILSHQVPGVSNPDFFSNIFRQGDFSYSQIQHLAKAGSIDALQFNAMTGAVTSISTFGVSAVVAFAMSLWRGENPKLALQNAAYAGLKIGGASLAVSLLATQATAAGAATAFGESAMVAVSAMGPTVTNLLANAFSTSGSLYGPAAAAAAANILKSNALSAVVMTTVMSTFDIIDAARGRISKRQLAKNCATTAAGVTGGFSGWLGGAALGSALLPGPGTFVGAFAGAMGVGALASRLANFTVGEFVEDDSKEMLQIIEAQLKSLSLEYLMNSQEVENCVEMLSHRLTPRRLKDMFGSDDREAFACDLLLSVIEEILAMRPQVNVASDEAIANQMRESLSRYVQRDS